MPRDKRLNIAGGVYHVYTRGIERKDIFKDDADREEFISRLADSLDKTKSSCYAWALMPNHAHLMIRTGKGSLSDIARRLFTGYAIYYNARHKRRGYLYQNRYKSILCQEDIYFEELVRYIHLNPLKAKIVSTINQLDKYSWTGHSAIIGRIEYPWQDIDEVLFCFGKRKNQAISRYRKFIKDGLDQKPRVDFMGAGIVRSAGGWSNFAGLKRKKEYWRGDERILGDSSFVNRVLKEAEERIEQKDELRRAGWDLTKLAEKACRILNTELKSIKKRSKSNSISEARAVICYWGVQYLGLSGVEIGEFLNISKQAVSKNLKRGEGIVERLEGKLIS